MHVAVVGATGHIGRLVHRALERRQHTVVPFSRAHGVDVRVGTGLASALEGSEVVIDVTNSTATDSAETVDFFSGTTQRLLAAESAAGVKHHVVLSIVGLWKVSGNAHYEGKRAQETTSPKATSPTRSCPRRSSTTSPTWSRPGRRPTAWHNFRPC